MSFAIILEFFYFWVYNGKVKTPQNNKNTLEFFMKRLATVLITSLLLIAMLGAMAIPVFATDTQNEVLEGTYIQESISAEDILPSNDELLAGYLEQKIYESQGISPFAIRLARDSLSDFDKTIYDALKAEIKKVANGTATSTQITVALDSTITYTDAELDEDIIINEEFNNAAANEAYAKIEAKYSHSLSKLRDALLADFPYELYWFDKTKGISLYPGWHFYSNGSSMYVENFTFVFHISNDFASSTPYSIDASKTSSVNTAVTNAQTIVTQNASKTDIQKLTAYKDKICEITDYNHSAAENTDTPYGNPWQLIWVFDGDASTKVVCEGYAKAFKYLCDMSEFSADVYCYTVTGYMDGGRHMWNVVEISGENYLADVTNSDSGSIGQSGSLFLAGGNASYSGQLHAVKVNGSQSINYQYYGSEADLYCDGFLVLSTKSYSTSNLKTLTVVNGTINGDASSEGSFAPGTSVTVKAKTLLLKGFDGWTVKSGSLSLSASQLKSETLTFTMPNGNVELEATYHTHSYRYSYNDQNHWKECSVCHEKKNEAVHSVGLGTVTKKATCAEEGVKTFSCTCGYSYTKAINKLDHTHTVWKYNDTTHWKKCSECTDTTEAEPHDHSQVNVTSKPSCNKVGEKTLNCECGHSYTEPINKTSHEYSSEVTKPASVDEEGELTYTCTCGDSYTESIPKLTPDTPEDNGGNAPDNDNTPGVGDNGTSSGNSGSSTGNNNTSDGDNSTSNEDNNTLGDSNGTPDSNDSSESTEASNESTPATESKDASSDEATDSEEELDGCSATTPALSVLICSAAFIGLVPFIKKKKEDLKREIGSI